jgi:hypothetical protein
MDIAIRLLGFLLISAIFSSCTERVSQHSITTAKLKRVAGALSKCEPRPISEAEIDACLRSYARENAIADSMINQIILIDGYGGKIVVTPSKSCYSKNPKIPYSTGKNRVDECGGGDDVSD